MPSEKDNSVLVVKRTRYVVSKGNPVASSKFCPRVPMQVRGHPHWPAIPDHLQPEVAVKACTKRDVYLIWHHVPYEHSPPGVLSETYLCNTKTYKSTFYIY